MPKHMPNLAGIFATAVDHAIDLAVAGERARVLLSAGSSRVQPLRLDRIEMLYEMAFLRIFTQWEVFLEQSFLRYISGYTCSVGPATMISGRYYSSLADAEIALLAGQQFLLWHNPTGVLKRVRRFVQTGLHEQVIASNQFRLEQFAAIRHRIAHAQEHARNEFDLATMRLHASRYKGGRPGKFLRDWAVAPIPQRWLEAIAFELKGLSNQVTP